MPMPKRHYRTISKRAVDALAVQDKDAVFWDRDLPGFGVRVYPSGRKVYVVQTRGPGGSKRATVGRHGDISPDTARKAAARTIDRIKTGADPSPPDPPEAEPTVADLAARFLREHVAVHYKASTAVYGRRLVGKRIVPALGSLPVSTVAREHVSALHHEMRGTPAQANITLSVLSQMFTLAERWGLRKEASNPCRFVRRYKECPRERFLSREEFRRLGATLDAVEAEGAVHANAAAAIRLLLLTGCRCSEILELQWRDVDFDAGELRLRDSKTGPRSVPLTPEAAGVLAGIARVPGNPWVIASPRSDGHLFSLQRSWGLVRERAGLDDVRLHDLRHSFASRALALGESLPMIGKLLGHGQVQTTERYAHLARASVKASAAKVADSIGAAILPDGHAARGGAD